MLQAEFNSQLQMTETKGLRFTGSRHFCNGLTAETA